MSYRSSLGRWSLAVPVLALAAFAGCEMDKDAVSDKPDPEEAIATAYEPVVLSSGGEVVTIDPFRTLINVDLELRSTFSFKEVMDAIVVRSGFPNLTATDLYRQWWDTNNDAAHARTSGPHCVPPPDPYNMVCPRQEANLADPPFDPFVNNGTGLHGYSLLSAVNRFDLAPANGANCGEFRLTFAKNSGKTRANDRNLISIEALMPNPNPSQGIAACKPLAQFWVDLSLEENATARAVAVKNFFLNGLPGFPAPIHPDHLGLQGGQIRTNQFMTQFGAQLWQLKEYRTKKWCSQFVQNMCTLQIESVQVANHIDPDLLSGESTSPLAPAARAAFLASMQSLLAPSLETITLTTPDTWNPLNSDGFLKRSDLAFRISNNNVAANVTFQTQITDRLTQLGETNLTWQHVMNRASTQLCAGCHQAANNKPLGNGLFWPPSNTFTHIDEARTEAVVDEVGQQIGVRPLISPALKSSFLPFRKAQLERYFAANP